MSKGRVLGLDFGEKRIGVAVSDPLCITARGVGFITYHSLDESIAAVEKYCREYIIHTIVVGYPLTMAGAPGTAAQSAAAFAERLRGKLNLPVILVDERLTTSRAEKTLIAGGVRRAKRRLLRDKLAASLILETYLARAGPARKSEPHGDGS